LTSYPGIRNPGVYYGFSVHSTSDIGISRVAGRVTGGQGSFVPLVSLTLPPELPVFWWRAFFDVSARFLKNHTTYLSVPVKALFLRDHSPRNRGSSRPRIDISVCFPGAGTERRVILPSPALFLHYISRQAVPDYWTISGIVSLLNGGAEALNFVLFYSIGPAIIPCLWLPAIRPLSGFTRLPVGSTGYSSLQIYTRRSNVRLFGSFIGSISWPSGRPAWL
jgi:hypothetical protein